MPSNRVVWARFVLSVVTVTAMTVMFGCKKPDGSTAGVPDTFPERVGESGDATTTLKVGVLGKNGGKRLLVDLEKLPEYGSANLWSCYKLPADDFLIGKALCTGDSSKNVDISAASVDFTCEVNKDFGTVKAKSPLGFDLCPSYEVHAFVFKPALELKIAE